jgi:hypothetical protein
MTQTIVNFLANTSPSTANPVFELDPRVFSLDISLDAQSYYIYEMNLLQAALTDFQNNSTQSTTDTSSINDAQTIKNVLTILNNWSQLQIEATRLDPTTNQNVFVQTNGNVGGLGSLGQIINDPTTGQIEFVPPTDPNSPVTTAITTTMDSYMAENVDNLIRTFRSAGWDPTTSDISPTGNTQLPSNVLTALQNLTSTATAGIYSVSAIIANALSAASQASIIGNSLSNFDSSIQQLLMVDYVSTGNQILFNEMNQLQSAININQQTLSYLNMLQDLMNQKDPQQFIQQLQILNATDPTSGAVAQPGQTGYDNFEQQTYNQVLNTITRFTTGSTTDTSPLTQYFQNISTSSPDGSGTLANQAFIDLSQAVPQMIKYSLTSIINNLTYLKQHITLAAGNDGSALANSIGQVLSDFKNLDPGSTASESLQAQALQKWVQDTTTGTTGTYQQNLSNAIVSSQSFNDTERENLSSVMFTYEEFYKSADSLLNSLNQLITKMAGAISR